MSCTICPNQNVITDEFSQIELKEGKEMTTNKMSDNTGIKLSVVCDSGEVTISLLDYDNEKLFTCKVKQNDAQWPDGKTFDLKKRHIEEVKWKANL